MNIEIKTRRQSLLPDTLDMNILAMRDGIENRTYLELTDTIKMLLEIQRIDDPDFIEEVINALKQLM